MSACFRCFLQGVYREVLELVTPRRTRGCEWRLPGVLMNAGEVREPGRKAHLVRDIVEVGLDLQVAHKVVPYPAKLAEQVHRPEVAVDMLAWRLRQPAAAGRATEHVHGVRTNRADDDDENAVQWTGSPTAAKASSSSPWRPQERTRVCHQYKERPHTSATRGKRASPAGRQVTLRFGYAVPRPGCPEG